MSFRRLLVPLQFHPENGDLRLDHDSREAIDQALQFADAAGCPITLAHVFACRETDGLPTDDGDLPSIRATLDALAQLAKGRDVEADTVLLFGSPATQIADLAADPEVDLVVMGTRQRPGQGDSLLGSTAAAVSTHSPTPTWIARHSSTRLGAVIVATDLTDACLGVLRCGLAVARAMTRDLHIVHACDPGRGEDLALLRVQLEAQMAQIVPDGIPPRYVSHVEPGDPATVLWRVARENKAHVMVVGVQEHTLAERILRGNTAEDILSELPCSLLTVPIDRPPHTTGDR